MRNSFCRAVLVMIHFACFIFLFSFSKAQTPKTYSSADIYLQLKKLNVLGSVLYIAAHPDDENTRLLGYLAKGKEYRTGYMALTRGDGGQNLIGDEQGVELGLIRTQELLAARRNDGAQQFFSRAFDFGFCKTADEALKTWGHDSILSDVVWVIRKFRPDVIITRFPGDARAGHGHHAASAILANEAFKAAADPNMFPEQFKYGVQPWQAKRILWNTFNFGGNNTTSDDQFKIDVGGYNSLLGKSYGEIAADSRSMHKSQGFGVPAQRGQAYEFFLTTGGDAPKDSLMDGVNTTWTREEGGAEIEAKINHIIEQYNFEHPEYSVDSLVELYKNIQRLTTRDVWWETKLEEVRNLIIECSGIFADATTSSEYAVQGSNVDVQFTVNRRLPSGVELKEIRMDDENGDFDSTVSKPLMTDINFDFRKSFPVSFSKEVSQPYWLKLPMNSGSYNVDDQREIGRPQSDPAYEASFVFEARGIQFIIHRPVMYKHTDPVKGELYEPLIVIPPVIVSLSPPVVLTNVKPGNAFTDNPMMQVQYKSNISAKSVPVTININQGSNIVYTKDTIVDFEEGKVFTLLEPVKKVFDNNDGKNLTADVFATLNGHKYVFTHYMKLISYEHIPDVHYFYRDNIKVINEEIKTVGKNIGYIVGAGDKVPYALEQMGYKVAILSPADITDENLKQFDAVIAGVRVYNVDDWMSTKYDVLMRYVQNGGNYIVQYNTSGFTPTKMKIGPYDFSLSHTRVTDENADVHILVPNSAALNYPNKITQDDFKDWIQERSIYQAEQLDSHYTAPLGMHDANEPESNGSLIITKYGKGNFVYTGLVFFRELPAGVPGAYRLMANLIALPKNQ